MQIVLCYFISTGLVGRCLDDGNDDSRAENRKERENENVELCRNWRYLLGIGLPDNFSWQLKAMQKHNMDIFWNWGYQGIGSPDNSSFNYKLGHVRKNEIMEICWNWRYLGIGLIDSIGLLNSIGLTDSIGLLDNFSS